MDDRTNPSGAGLYDQDFYAWTQEQAALIRDGRLSEADLTNLVEEIETLGTVDSRDSSFGSGMIQGCF